jgi:hypothetical protein
MSGCLRTRSLILNSYLFDKNVYKTKLRFIFYINWGFCCKKWNICVTNAHGDVLLVVSTSRSFPHSWRITWFVSRLTRRVSLVEQELLTLTEHLISPPVFSGVCLTRVIRHEWGKDREVLTTSKTSPWAFVTQIFHFLQQNPQLI